MPMRHNLIQPPAMPDPLRSLGEMLSLAQGLDSHRDQKQLDAAYEPIDVPSQSSSVPGGGVPGGGPGTGALPPGATIPGAVSTRPATTRPPTRNEILARAPGRLRGAVQKQFDDADAAASRAIKADDEAAAADADYLGQLGITVRGYNYDPQAFQSALDHAKDRYKKNPSRLQAIQQFETQAQGDPSHIKRTVDAAILASPEQQKLEAQRVKAPTSDYSRALQTYRDDTGDYSSAGELAFKTSWDKTNDTTPNATSIEAAILAADKKGDTKEVNRLIAIGGRLSAQRRAPGEDPGTKRDDKQYDRDWNEYKEYLGQYERTQPKSDALTSVVAALLSGKTPEEAARDAGTSTTTYKMPPDFATWRTAHKGVTPPAAAKPAAPPTAAAAGSQHAVGDVVTVQGKQIKITKLYGDGTFDGDVVK